MDGQTLSGTILLAMSLIAGIALVTAPTHEENTRLKKENAQLQQQLETTQQRLIDQLLQNQQ
jgi:type II secretory pathway pseudopilin PulG